MDSIGALFSEKEKEISLAVVKVEVPTRQLEDLRRNRRCPINVINDGNSTSRELYKLRRKLMVSFPLHKNFQKSYAMLRNL